VIVGFSITFGFEEVAEARIELGRELYREGVEGDAGVL